MSMNILLVEDNSADAYLLTEMFAKKREAPEIHWVTDGYFALDYMFQRADYAQANRPDLILLDLNLPRINGYEVLKEIKDNAKFASIPVIILTTSRDPLDHAQCKTLGADMCLSKPHGIKDYERMVQLMMEWTALRLATPSNNNQPVN